MSSSLAIQPFNSLPNEVLSQTLGELDNSNLLNARLVCKLFNQVAEQMLVNRTNARGKSLLSSFDLSLKMQGIFNHFQNGIYTETSFTAATRAISIIEPQKEGILTVAATSNTITMWNEKGAILKVFDGIVESNKEHMGHTNSITGMQIVKGHLYTSSCDGTVKKWDLKDQKCVETFKCHQEAIICLKVEGDNLYTGSKDRTVKKWKISSKECLATFKPFYLTYLPNNQYSYSSTPQQEGHFVEQGGVTSLTICREKLYVAHHVAHDAGPEGIFVVWDLDNGNPLYLVRSLVGSEVQVYDLQKQSLHKFETKDSDSIGISHIRLHEDKIFVVFSANIIHIIDLKNTTFKSINNSREGVLTGFEMMGDRLLSISAEGIVKLWDLDGTLLKTLQWVAKKAVYSINFKNKKMCLGFVDGEVRVINYGATDRKVLKEIARKFKSGINMTSRLQAMPKMIQDSIMKQLDKIEQPGAQEKKKKGHFNLFKKHTSENESNPEFKLFAKAIKMHLKTSKKEGKE